MSDDPKPERGPAPDNDDAEVRDIIERGNVPFDVHRTMTDFGANAMRAAMSPPLSADEVEHLRQRGERQGRLLQEAGFRGRGIRVIDMPPEKE
jgi:hypothetical protein